MYSTYNYNIYIYPLGWEQFPYSFLLQKPFSWAPHHQVTRFITARKPRGLSETRNAFNEFHGRASSECQGLVNTGALWDWSNQSW